MIADDGFQSITKYALPVIEHCFEQRISIEWRPSAGSAEDAPADPFPTVSDDDDAPASEPVDAPVAGGAADPSDDDAVAESPLDPGLVSLLGGDVPAQLEELLPQQADIDIPELGLTK
jgi:hypothetical protein